MSFTPITGIEKALCAIAKGEKISNPATGVERALAEIAKTGIGGGATGTVTVDSDELNTELEAILNE